MTSIDNSGVKFRQLFFQVEGKAQIFIFWGNRPQLRQNHQHKLKNTHKTGTIEKIHQNSSENSVCGGWSFCVFFLHGILKNHPASHHTGQGELRPSNNGTGIPRLLYVPAKEKEGSFYLSLSCFACCE
jgi:hypothetical protein